MKTHLVVTYTQLSFGMLKTRRMNVCVCARAWWDSEMTSYIMYEHEMSVCCWFWFCCVRVYCECWICIRASPIPDHYCTHAIIMFCVRRGGRFRYSSPSLPFVLQNLRARFFVGFTRVVFTMLFLPFTLHADSFSALCSCWVQDSIVDFACEMMMAEEGVSCVVTIFIQPVESCMIAQRVRACQKRDYRLVWGEWKNA